MEIIIRRRDVYVVAIALAVFFSWVAHAAYKNAGARAELRAPLRITQTSTKHA